jgi:KipI family sensor histidine kinase inhibitor
VQFGRAIDPVTQALVHRALRRLERAAVDGLVDLAIGYTTLTATFRLADLDHAAALARVLAAINNPEPDAGADAGHQLRTVDIPVDYGGPHGPDLSFIAERTGLSERAVVDLHAGGEYTVGFLGFTPGFAYLLGLPAALAAPRLATPRTRVPAGSVGIAGAQTAVYPGATPGGWRLIGIARVRMFDPSRDEPALLRPGDRVRFVIASFERSSPAVRP